MNKFFPIISVKGTAYECGLQHGEQAAGLIKRNIDYYLDYWRRNLRMSREDIYDHANNVTKTVDAYDEELMKEIKGVAEGSDTDLETVVAMNGRYELAWANPEQLMGGCTSIAATHEATEGKVTLLAQNWDYRLGVRDTCVVLEISQEGTPGIVMHTEAGVIGHKGMNSLGIGVTLNAMVSDQDRLGDSVPFLLVCRRMLKSSLLTEALKALLDAERCVSYNVLVGCEGVIVDLEAHPSDVSVITPKEGTLTHTNHFVGSRSHNVKDMYLRSDPSTIHRLIVADNLMKKGKHSIESFKDILSNHRDYPESICYHPNPRKTLDHQEETLSSLIMDLTNKQIYITKGPPCINKYTKYTPRYLKVC